MKNIIKIEREIVVPNELICHYGRSGMCTGLVDAGKENYKICANFNDYCFWSDKAGYFVRCRQCVDAQRKFWNQKEVQR